jgi:D-3-phosphoglycerate dehydrogenase / 2-oxoglutarate reductase
MKVAILDDYTDTLRTLPCFGKLGGHDVTIWNDHTDDVDVLAERLAGTEALVLIRERTAIRRPLLERLPALRLISQRSVYPHIDVDACTEHGVVLSSDLHSASASVSTCELTWGLILAARRRIPQQVAALRAGTWQTEVGHALLGSTLGIYGYGRIGRVVAGYGRAFGMRVQVWSGESSREQARDDGYEVPATREAFFATSDVVTVHLRLVPATRGIVTAEDLAAMKPTALFVNTSRAGLVDPGVLEAALAAGRPGAAAVDVYDTEPVTDASGPLFTNPDVVATPHIGYVTFEELEIQFSTVFDQINDFAAGRPSNVVNPEAIG